MADNREDSARRDPTYLLKSEIRQVSEGQHPSIRLFRYGVYLAAFLTIVSIGYDLATVFAWATVTAVLIVWRRVRMSRLWKRDISAAGVRRVRSFGKRREAHLHRHRSRMNWPAAASMLLTGHELATAEREGFDKNEQIIRAVTIRDAVLEEIGRDRFAHVLAEADYDMPTSSLEDVLMRALDISGYTEVRERLFPPGTEIAEYGEASHRATWTEMMSGLGEARRDPDLRDRADEFFKSLLIDFLTDRSGLKRDDPETARRLEKWYPSFATIDLATESYMSLDQGGEPPSKEQAAEELDRLRALLDRAD